MKGMSAQELEEVRAFVQKHHKFGYVPQEDRLPNVEYGFGIKYIDVCYDSRDQTYWAITFRPTGICFATNHFNALNLPPKGWKYNTLYDLCMAFLKGDFKPKEEFYRDPREEHPPHVNLRPLLTLDCKEDGTWFVKNTKTEQKQDTGKGDAGKLMALEMIHKDQMLV